MNFSELARHLDLSPTTVSRVLSGSADKYRISSATIDRVRSAADSLGVVADPLGTILKRGKLGMVGLLVPDITNSFFSGLARLIELELREFGVMVQLCDSAENADTELTLLRQMLGRRLDGLIVAPVGRNSPELVAAVRSSMMPLVMLDRIVPGLGVPSVCIDNAAAGELAIQELIETGHRRIGCLRGDPESFTDRERFRGVADAMGKSGLQMDEAWVAGAGYSREEGLAGARIILNSLSTPDAVIALTGQGILGILEAAFEIGLKIPDALSVIAFDEQPWSAFVSPPLTTVVQPISEMASKAVSAIMKLIATDPLETKEMVLQTQLMRRESVR